MTDLLLQAHSLLEAFHLPKTGSKPALNKYKKRDYDALVSKQQGELGLNKKELKEAEDETRERRPDKE